jgi:hypothetical protein
MTTTFEKLNFKDRKSIVVQNAPASFEPELATLSGITIHRNLNAAPNPAFILAFVTRQDEVDTIAAQAIARTKGDTILWFAYPKGTSKILKCDFNRDTGWSVLEAAGFDTVRAIAIDQDWTALRFRRIQFIKKSTRR